LNIRQLPRLVQSLEDIAKAIRFIPQMQQFLYSVDHLVWSPAKILREFLELPVDDKNNVKSFQPMHRLSETLKKLKEWRFVMDGEVRYLRAFREEVSRLLCVSSVPAAHDPTDFDVTTTKKIVDEIKRLMNVERDSDFRVYAHKFQVRISLIML
jgi:hypothetical protein